jgi:cell wall assembly regulator SMI1
MAVGFQEPGEPAPESAVERLEQHIGRRLPDDYRNFLLRQDGGWMHMNDGAVKEVYGVRDDAPKNGSLWRALDTFHGRVPSWLLPIARDEYGNLYTLSLREPDFGSIWFWDHEEEADEGDPPSEENIELKAGSWNEFFAGLQPVTI